MLEKWDDIKGYEGYYQVSNKGRVKSLLFQNNVWNKKYHREKILKYKGHTPRTGYKVDLWKDGAVKTFLVARLVAFTFYGEDISNSDLTVNHIDGNRMNNNFDNLELVTLKENIQHAFKTGLMTSCKPIELECKITNEKYNFYSMSKASVFIGRNAGYISGLTRIGKNENDDYFIKVLEEV